jgi:hypothetical protein
LIEQYLRSLARAGGGLVPVLAIVDGRVAKLGPPSWLAPPLFVDCADLDDAPKPAAALLAALLEPPKEPPLPNS